MVGLEHVSNSSTDYLDDPSSNSAQDLIVIINYYDGNMDNKKDITMFRNRGNLAHWHVGSFVRSRPGSDNR